MAKKFGKVLVFTAIAGVTAAGVYAYLQTKKEKEKLNDIDDFDLFDEEEPASKRKYVSLDGVKNIAVGAVGKVKEAAGKVKDKFTKKEEVIETAEEVVETAAEAAETAAESVQETVSEEEFFDDEQ